MALTQGSPLPAVDTTTTQATQAPEYYTGYLTDLAQAGQKAINTDPTKLVAGFSDLQTKGFQDVPVAADSYKPGLQAAQTTIGDVSKGLTSERINALMNPYTTNVVDEMARLQQQNLQRNVMPGLKAAFAGTGSSGSQRFANATGQTLADMQANLTGQQQGALSAGYQQALQAALQNLQLQNQAAVTQGNLAGQEQTLGLTGANAKLNAGAQQQALEQAKIDAPLKQATNAAQLLRGYTVPTATTQKYRGPMPGAYSASPLQQLAGMAALFASGANGTSAVEGIRNFYNSVTSPSGGGAPAQTGDGIPNSNTGSWMQDPPQINDNTGSWMQDPIYDPAEIAESWDQFYQDPGSWLDVPNNDSSSYYEP